MHVAHEMKMKKVEKDSNCVRSDSKLYYSCKEIKMNVQV